MIWPASNESSRPASSSGPGTGWAAGCTGTATEALNQAVHRWEYSSRQCACVINAMHICNQHRNITPPAPGYCHLDPYLMRFLLQDLQLPLVYRYCFNHMCCALMQSLAPCWLQVHSGAQRLSIPTGVCRLPQVHLHLRQVHSYGWVPVMYHPLSRL
jgi:hypothetical protein